MAKRNKSILSSLKLDLYTKDSKVIKFYRRNPCIACEHLLGIKLMDSQKLILQESWNKPYVLWACSRNFGKTFLGSIFILLKCLLYENQSIYIISNVGSQAQETFMKIEEIVLRMGKTSSSILSLKDIAMFETVKSPSCKTGFSHSQTGFHVKFYNGSEIFTLNGNPDNNRSKRATMVFFDEAGFSSDELIMVAEAFATQETDFKTSIEEHFNIDTLRKEVPTQLVYASSASEVDSLFFRKYKDFAKRMFAGDKNYYCADVPCTVALEPTIDGLKTKPLLKKSQVDNAMRTNREKAMREYYNKFTQDGGEEQIIKWSQIRRNETFILPEMANPDGKSKYIIAFDPARTFDNSVVTIMKIIDDPKIGYRGEIVNCANLVDLASKKGKKIKTPDQIAMLKQYILDYNGTAPDYENVLEFSIDAGAGGGGLTAYADNLLDDWRDKKGVTHKGFIDKEYELYEDEIKKYPNASNILMLINPKKYKVQMTEEFMKLMELDLISFPKEYSGNGFVTLEAIKNGEVELINRNLTMEEEIALINIDALKTEMTSIHRTSNSQNTVASYGLPKEKENKVHDDRFYTIIMLSHYLYEIRRRQTIKQDSKKMDYVDYYNAVNVMNGQTESLNYFN